MSRDKNTGGIYTAPKNKDYTPSEGRGRPTGVTAPRNTSSSVIGSSSAPWRQAIGDWTDTSITLPTGQRLSVADRGDEILAGLDAINKPSIGTGGPISNPYTDAIKILQKQLGGGAYGTSYDNLSTLLGTTSGTARGQIDQATADAIAQMSSRNALATPINYSAGTTQIPQTALNDYLNAIGASTTSVDAGRNFLQGLINASAGGAAQSQAAQQQAYDAQRQAGIDALTGNQQYQQANLSTATQAQQMAIAQAKEKERKALEDQILQYVLKGGVA